MIGCQTVYNYRLPSESEKKRNPPDSTKWIYDGGQVVCIPVVDDNGAFYKLPITPKTKIEIKDIYGTTYRFYLQSIRVDDNDMSLGGGKRWTGYELLNHAQATIAVIDIAVVNIISDSKAIIPIAIH